jgi:tetratricopeptide (TPR) repeat protein
MTHDRRDPREEGVALDEPVAKEIPARRVRALQLIEGWRTPRATRYAGGSLAIAAVLALAIAGVVNLTTSQPDAVQASAYVNAGLSAQSQGLIADAREDYQQALAHDPRNKLAYYNLGSIDSQQGHTELAVYDYYAALASDSNFFPALYNLAYLLAPSDPLQAVSLYQRATQVDPSNADAHLSLGFLLHSLGRDDEARTEFAAAVRITPTLAALVPPGLGPP